MTYIMENDNYLLPIGTLLRNGTYYIIRPLASGGFGNTYLVKHIGLDAEMVIKEFFIKGINSRRGDNTVTVGIPDNHSTFESQREKFMKEAQRLWRLKSPNIVGVHDIFEENQTVYYVMDFVNGESLSCYLLQKNRPLSENEVIPILTQLLDGLDVIHGASPSPIFHLDIKPGNIICCHDGRIVIIDFGASKQLSYDKSGVTSTLMTFTKGYAPAEQTDGLLDRIGPWTDFYALGATLYKILTNQQPPDPSEIINEGEDAFDFSKGISKKMRQLILWLMQPIRKHRPQSVTEIRNWLDERNESFASMSSFYSSSEETVFHPITNNQIEFSQTSTGIQDDETVITSVSLVSGTTHNALRFVDMGLSVKWADRSFGAATISDLGILNNGVVLDNSNEWQNVPPDFNGTSFDIVTNTMGYPFHLPTRYEWKELIEKCEWAWSEKNGVEGYTVTARNGNSIFLPFSVGYWSSTKGESKDFPCVYYLFINSYDIDLIYNVYSTLRCIRPVRQ